MDKSKVQNGDEGLAPKGNSDFEKRFMVFPTRMVAKTDGLDIMKSKSTS